jgi:hypothetical protein
VPVEPDVTWVSVVLFESTHPAVSTSKPWLKGMPAAQPVGDGVGFGVGVGVGDDVGVGVGFGQTTGTGQQGRTSQTRTSQVSKQRRMFSQILSMLQGVARL